MSAATLSRFERGLTASHRLASRVGDGDLDGRDVILDSVELVEAFDLCGPAALRAECLAAFAASTGGGTLDPA